MERLFVPNDGRMPSLESMPTLLQKPIALLKKLSCVAGVISGWQQADFSTAIVIHFTKDPGMDSRSALKCFSVTGIVPKHIQINHERRFMRLVVSHSKIALN